MAPVVLPPACLFQCRFKIVPHLNVSDINLSLSVSGDMQPRSFGYLNAAVAPCVCPHWESAV
jgi:hypothetical protein